MNKIYGKHIRNVILDDPEYDPDSPSQDASQSKQKLDAALKKLRQRKPYER